MSAHTPLGGWAPRRWSDAESIILKPGSPPVHVCGPALNADAAFIVQATECHYPLLEALTNLERYLRETPHHNAIEAAAARKAIAKATLPQGDAA